MAPRNNFRNEGEPERIGDFYGPRDDEGAVLELAPIGGNGLKSLDNRDKEFLDGYLPPAT